MPILLHSPYTKHCSNGSIISHSGKEIQSRSLVPENHVQFRVQMCKSSVGIRWKNMLGGGVRIATQLVRS
jgi:hypothetical protein